MKTISKQSAPKAAVVGKQRSYGDVVEFLDKNWTTNATDTSLQCIKQLDQAFGSIAHKLDTILIAGTNGKSLTAQFTTKLLQEEGLSVGTFYSPHILTYNERFNLNNETVNNKTFTDLANDVINMAETLGLKANTYDILTMMALLYFHTNKVNVAVLEVHEGGTNSATAICSPKIAAVTRVTSDETVPATDQIAATIKDILGIVKPKTHVVSADQSKLNLQVMLDVVKEKGGTWGMPIRKLAALSYPFEQLHGRCAALAERVASVYINECANKKLISADSSLLTKKKGQRGRPTLEAKRQSELNPKRTVEQFWKDTTNTLPGRFQLLDKEKPTLLLDNASNLDALKNVLLGIRLLNYQRPLKGLTLVLGCNNQELNTPELLKQLRYFFKKTSGSIIICDVRPAAGQEKSASWDVEKVTNDIKSMKIKARSASTFKEAFEAAQKSVDERHGLVVITGSSAIVTEYWKYKGIKKI